MTAGYWSRMTRGAGGVSLITAGEKHTEVADGQGPVVPGVEGTVRVGSTKVPADDLLDRELRV